MADPFNLADHFVHRHIREGRGAKVAIRYEDQAISYAQIAERVNRAANGLRGLGVEPRQRVLLVLPDSPEFVAAYFGAIQIGAVAVPTSTALRSADYAYLLDESEAAALVVHSDLYAQIEPILSERRFLRHVIVCGERRADRLHWNDWLDGQSDALAPESTEPDDIAFWLWTSGSTGMPKAAVHRHRD